MRPLLLRGALLLAACLAPLVANRAHGQQPQLLASLRETRPEDRQLLQSARQAIAQQGWSGIRLFANQSFPLLIDGKPAGALFSGDASRKGEGDKCFITLVEPGRPVLIVVTVEEFAYVKGIPACQTVRALGLLASPDPETIRIGVLYTISLHIEGDPHGVLDGTDAVVLSLNRKSHHLSVDGPATQQASAKSPENLPALQAALLP